MAEDLEERVGHGDSQKEQAILDRDRGVAVVQSEREEQQRVGADHHARDGHYRPDRVDYWGRPSVGVIARRVAHESKRMPLAIDSPD